MHCVNFAQKNVFENQQETIWEIGRTSSWIRRNQQCFFILDVTVILCLLFKTKEITVGSLEKASVL